MSYSQPDPNLSQLLYSALSVSLGLLVRTADFAALRASLYTTRRKLEIPELAQLQFLESWLPDGDLIILRSESKSQTENL